MPSVRRIAYGAAAVLRIRRGFVVAALAALFSLGACTDLAATLPERPTPVPTLARLPSVTPAPPVPTTLPATPTVLASTPTPEPPVGRVVLAANVRAGPGLEHAVVGGLAAGAPVRLLGRFDAWYLVQGPGELRGWMASQVLEVDPVIAALVPEARP